MPRRRIDVQPSSIEPSRRLTNRLAEELESGKDFGQPLIYEQEYTTRKSRVIVIWDAWVDASLEERSAIILKAYERVGGRETREKIALASGLTIPEAAAAGMLPFQVISGRRPSDAATEEQIKDAMIRQGASQLDSKAGLQLRFATEEEAEACRKRLIEDLPVSEPIWILHREISSADSFAFADVVGAESD